MMAFCQCELVLVGNAVAQIEGLPMWRCSITKLRPALSWESVSMCGVLTTPFYEHTGGSSKAPPGIKRLGVQGTLMIRA